MYKPGETTPQALGICIYGKSGSGKTSLIGTMPGKGLVIDVPQLEGGTFVLEDQADHIDVVPVATWRAINEIWWHLNGNTHEYKWVALDSITALQELAKRHTIAERNLDADPHMISLNEYGKIGRLVGELVYKFRTLKIHQVFIAQEKRSQRDDEPVMIEPDVMPSALSMFIPTLTLVGRLSVEMGEEGWERHLRIGTHEKYQTKARSKPGVDVPSVIRRPDLKQILTYILRGTGERPDEVKDDGLVVLG